MSSVTVTEAAPSVSIALEGSMNQYIVGTNIVLTANFKDPTGTLADPTTVLAEVLLPTGILTPIVATKSAVGVYAANFTPTMSGLYAYRFAGAGVLAAAAEGSFMAQTTF